MIKEVEKHDALEEARKELFEERLKANVRTFKDKLRELEDAKAIVRNLDRDLTALENEVGANL